MHNLYNVPSPLSPEPIPLELDGPLKVLAVVVVNRLGNQVRLQTLDTELATPARLLVTTERNLMRQEGVLERLFFVRQRLLLTWLIHTVPALSLRVTLLTWP